MKQKDIEKVKEFFDEYARAFVYCFSFESTKKWKDYFFNARWQNFLDEDLDKFTQKVGIKLENEKVKKEVKNIYYNLFMEKIDEYLIALKKAKDEETREQIKKYGVKRKKD